MPEETITKADVGTVEASGVVAPPDKHAKHRKRQAELQKQKDELLALRQPHREYLDQCAADTKRIEAARVIKETNPILAEIENELAMYARAIGTKASLQVEPGQYSRE